VSSDGPRDEMFGESYNRMIDLFGGDATATRAACALSREGVTSIELLAGMAGESGDRVLLKWLRSIPGVGRLCQERIIKGLQAYRKREGEGND
jgi:hypothetical protein